jgi:hypothetical protein
VLCPNCLWITRALRKLAIHGQPDQRRSVYLPERGAPGGLSPLGERYFPNAKRKGPDISKYRWLSARVLATPFDGSPEGVRRTTHRSGLAERSAFIVTNLVQALGSAFLRVARISLGIGLASCPRRRLSVSRGATSESTPASFEPAPGRRCHRGRVRLASAPARCNALPESGSRPFNALANDSRQDRPEPVVSDQGGDEEHRPSRKNQSSRRRFQHYHLARRPIVTRIFC